MARKRFGQHFLVDDSVIAAIVASIAPNAQDTLVEIGPGTGALTWPLLQTTGRLHCIELDRDLVPKLQNDPRSNARELIVHEHDVLAFALRSISQTPRSLRVVGNLPYNISTPLMFHLQAQRDLIQDMHFMVQKEVATRIAAVPGNKHYGRLGVMLALDFTSELLFEVEPGAFSPPPKVQSAVLRICHRQQPLDVGDRKLFDRLVASAFNQRRKTLHNALKPLASDELMQAAEIDPQWRADVVSPEAFARLSRRLHEMSDS